MRIRFPRQGRTQLGHSPNRRIDCRLIQIDRSRIHRWQQWDLTAKEGHGCVREQGLRQDHNLWGRGSAVLVVAPEGVVHRNNHTVNTHYRLRHKPERRNNHWRNSIGGSLLRRTPELADWRGLWGDCRPPKPRFRRVLVICKTSSQKSSQKSSLRNSAREGRMNLHWC